MWRWDGREWVPTLAPPPLRSKAWIWWLAGGLTLSLLLIVVGPGTGVLAGGQISRRGVQLPAR